MSDKAKVFVKYDVEIEKFGEKKRCKGVISNTYRGYDPVGMVTRNHIGLLYFVNKCKSLFYLEPWNDIYQEFRRMFDVDFYRVWMDVSTDNLEYAVKRCFIEGDTSWTFNDLVQFADTDFGEFYVDITGKGPNQLNIKYCYCIWKNTEQFLVDAKGYLENHYKGFDLKELNEETKGALEEFDKMVKEYNIELMTESELKELWNTDYENFLVEYIPNQNNDTEEINRVIEYDNEGFVISLDDLDLSVRTYNCLRRAGYSTVKEVRNLSQEQLNDIRNLGTKQQEELVDKIELTRRK